MLNKKAYKKIEKAIKKGNWAKMAKICEKYNFGVEACEELVLRAIYSEYHHN